MCTHGGQRKGEDLTRCATRAQLGTPKKGVCVYAYHVLSNWTWARKSQHVYMVSWTPVHTSHPDTQDLILSCVMHVMSCVQLDCMGQKESVLCLCMSCLVQLGLGQKEPCVMHVMSCVQLDCTGQEEPVYSQFSVLCMPYLMFNWTVWTGGVLDTCNTHHVLTLKIPSSQGRASILTLKKPSFHGLESHIGDIMVMPSKLGSQEQNMGFINYKIWKEADNLKAYAVKLYTTEQERPLAQGEKRKSLHQICKDVSVDK
ncbi:hypothetical protein EDB85DRAFT_1892398 [Lactarius pseudohatsudake]|nr:hypothetical protein EDB85DRAFT_1898517 [Lactarius pseudohatsudake]KAH9028790.1 hypothetical protein EDB85DRAFT_1892398 [Lactarius pseudohatsudake]